MELTLLQQLGIGAGVVVAVGWLLREIGKVIEKVQDRKYLQNGGFIGRTPNSEYGAMAALIEESRTTRLDLGTRLDNVSTSLANHCGQEEARSKRIDESLAGIKIAIENSNKRGEA